VLDPAGVPLAGARVMAAVEASGRLTYPETRTDAAGSFSLPVDDESRGWQGWIAAAAPGYGLVWTALQTSRPVTLRLTAHPVSCSGLVTDSAGKPIPGARLGVVVLVLPEGRGRAPWSGFLSFSGTGESPLLQATTDAAGHFTLPDLPAGYTLGLTARAPGYAPSRGDYEEAGATDAVLTLAPEATIAGRVTRDGQPVAGVRVGTSWRAESAPAVTAADGSYLLSGLGAARYRVELRDFPEGWTAPALSGVGVEAGEHVTGCDLHLTRGAVVTGTVREAGTNQPLAGVRVVASGPMSSHPSSESGTLTDAQGVYHLRVAAGRNWVYYLGKSSYDSRYWATPDSRELTVPEGETREGVDFTLTAPTRISGRVVLADGRPVAGAQVGGDNFMFLAPGDPEAAGEAVSDADGRFVLPPSLRLAPALRSEEGLGRLLAVDPVRGLAALTYVNDESPITLTMTPGGWLVGKVVDLAGQPLADLRVEFLLGYETEHPCRSIVTAVTDRAGRVRLGPLPAGVTVHATPAGETALLAAPGELPEVSCRGPIPAPPPGYKPDRPGAAPAAPRVKPDNPWLTMGEFKLGPGEVRAMPVLHLNLARHSVRGTVVDAAGHPVAGALVGCGESREAARTDAAGHFQLGGLKTAAPVSVLALHPTERLAGAQELTPDQPGEQRLTLQPMGMVLGQLRDTHGRPTAHTNVVVTAVTGLPRSLPPALQHRLGGNDSRDWAQTDAQGNWRDDRLVGGVTYYFFSQRNDDVDAPGPKPGPGTWQINRSEFWQAEITVSPGQTVDMTQYLAELWPCAGTVRDAAGHPVPDAQIRAEGFRDSVAGPESAPHLPTHQGIWMAGVSGPDGQFVMSLVPRGASFQLTVTATGYASQSQEVTVTADTAPLAITLMPEASLSGHVRRGGQPVAGVTVSAVMTSGGSAGAPNGCGCDGPGAGRSGQAVTGADGSYLISGLAAGTFRVSLAWNQKNLYAAPLEGKTLQAGDHLTGCDLSLVRR
jgi:hypothetical protein